jgi:hypothetical protein
MGQVTVVWDGHVDIGVEFFEDIDQGRGRGDAFGYGKAQPMGLAGAVIRVLAQQDDLDLIDGGGVKGVENETTRRINADPAHFLRFQKGDDLQEVGFGELLFEGLFPAFFDFYIHRQVFLLFPAASG